MGLTVIVNEMQMNQRPERICLYVTVNPLDPLRWVGSRRRQTGSVIEAKTTNPAFRVLAGGRSSVPRMRINRNWWPMLSLETG